MYDNSHRWNVQNIKIIIYANKKRQDLICRRVYIRRAGTINAIMCVKL